jgi:hypothetical protein
VKYLGERNCQVICGNCQSDVAQRNLHLSSSLSSVRLDRERVTHICGDCRLVPARKTIALAVKYEPSL